MIAAGAQKAVREAYDSVRLRGDMREGEEGAVLGCFEGREGEEEGEGERLRRERRDMMGERKKGGNGARLICWRAQRPACTLPFLVIFAYQLRIAPVGRASGSHARGHNDSRPGPASRPRVTLCDHDFQMIT